MLDRRIDLFEKRQCHVSRQIYTAWGAIENEARLSDIHIELAARRFGVTATGTWRRFGVSRKQREKFLLVRMFCRPILEAHQIGVAIGWIAAGVIGESDGGRLELREVDCDSRRHIFDPEVLRGGCGS